jgi:hypothetical protein
MATTRADAAMPLWGRSLLLGSALIGFAERWLAPLLFLAIRLWMAEIFLRSGLLKSATRAARSICSPRSIPCPSWLPGLALIW